MEIIRGENQLCVKQHTQFLQGVQFELHTWAFGATWEQTSEAKYNSTFVLLDYLHHIIVGVLSNLRRIYCGEYSQSSVP